MNHSETALYEIMYRGFGPIQILEDGNWFFDDEYPGNVCHHIMSLRWLGQVKSPSIVAQILHSFIAYHASSKNRHSRYYLGPTADHTTSIRLAELLSAKKANKTDENLKNLLRQELEKNIHSCLTDTYKENNNHGLMVDKAVLLCLTHNNWLLERFKSQTRFVVNRIEKQLDGIFDAEGYCKEHSTSYQEYNLGIALDLLDIMKPAKNLGFDAQIEALTMRVNKIKIASRKALGFLLKDDGTYITVGDSFSTPKFNILEKAFGSRDPKIALLPESEQHGVFFNKTLGISVYRDNNIHMVINASWHSYVHKQNDDLNIFLRVHGQDIFVEGGYSDIISSNDINSKSEQLHSTITVPSESWLSRNHVTKGSSLLSAPVIIENNNTISFYGKHTRISGCSVERRVNIQPAKGRIEIIDKVNPVKTSHHRFILPKDMRINIDKTLCQISNQDSSLKISFSNTKPDTETWTLADIKIITNNSLSSAHALCFTSTEEYASFLLTYETGKPKYYPVNIIRYILNKSSLLKKLIHKQ